MSQSLNCPSCGAPLDYDLSTNEAVIHCPFCRTSVLMPVSLQATGVRPSSGFQQAEGHAQEMREICRLLKAGNKIEAIKLYRDAFHTGLKEAKDAVDAMGRAGLRPAAQVGSGQSAVMLPAQESSNKNVTRSILLIFLGILVFGILFSVLIAKIFFW